MVAQASLIPAPPMVRVNNVGRLQVSVPVIDTNDPHVGLGVTYERDLQINGTAVWGGNACEVGGSAKGKSSIYDLVTGIPYTVFQQVGCRMLNEWNTLGNRLGTLFEDGEWRTIEDAFATALAAGAYGTVSAGPVATTAGPLSVFAVAEQYIHTQMTYGTILASPEVITFAISKAIVVREGDRLFTVMGTPVIELPGLGDDVYVTGQITIWRGQRSDPRPVQEIPFTNEFVVLAERIYTIAVEGSDAVGSMEIVKWTVNLTVA